MRGLNVNESAGNARGHRGFVDKLARFAGEVGDTRVTVIHNQAAAPLRVAVHGRPGVGRRTVARALRIAGLHVGEPGEIDVFVVAEVVKPEDRAAIAGSSRPKIVVLNKADLCGFGPGGPMAVAADRCARYHRLTGVPTIPMVAHLAAAELDDELIAALRLLTTEPADLSSTDAFVDGPHPLPVGVRRRLLETLDLFGIAVGVLALRGNAEPNELLRQRSGIDDVIDSLPVAEAGYQRVRAAVTALEALAAVAETGLAQRVGAFLTADDTVIAQMAAAVDVVEAVGLQVDPGDDSHAHLRRAVTWQRYARGPVSAAHRACGTDIARGSLRLLGRAGQ
jgi:hypothetical protein